MLYRHIPCYTKSEKKSTDYPKEFVIYADTYCESLEFQLKSK